MQSIWLKRAFRMWLVVLLPLAIYCGFQAFSYNRTAAESRDLAARWLETELKNEREGTAGNFDARHERNEMLRNAYSSTEKRDNYVLAAALLLTLPLSVAIVIALLRWIWGKRQIDKDEQR